MELWIEVCFKVFNEPLLVWLTHLLIQRKRKRNKMENWDYEKKACKRNTKICPLAIRRPLFQYKILGKINMPLTGDRVVWPVCIRMNSRTSFLRNFNHCEAMSNSFEDGEIYHWILINKFAPLSIGLTANGFENILWVSRWEKMFFRSLNE